MIFGNWVTNPMAKCTKCGAETKLFDRGVAICPKCLDLQESKSNVPVDEIAKNLPQREGEETGRQERRR